MSVPQTVVELPEFLRRAKAIMTDDERAAVVDWSQPMETADERL
jgi:hypothetical protein